MPKAAAPTIEEILHGSTDALTIFSQTAIGELEIFLKKGKPYLKCLASAKDRPAKPEEIVRQLYIKKLLDYYGYPVERIAVEKPVYFGSTVHEKAADIVIADKDDPATAYVIVECKKPKRTDGLEQLKSYCHAEGSPNPGSPKLNTGNSVPPAQQIRYYWEEAHACLAKYLQE
jgi:type I restriction enzyme M protein